MACGCPVIYEFSGGGEIHRSDEDGLGSLSSAYLKSLPTRNRQPNAAYMDNGTFEYIAGRSVTWRKLKMAELGYTWQDWEREVKVRIEAWGEPIPCEIHPQGLNLEFLDAPLAAAVADFSEKPEDEISVKNKPSFHPGSRHIDTAGIGEPNADEIIGNHNILVSAINDMFDEIATGKIENSVRNRVDTQAQQSLMADAMAAQRTGTVISPLAAVDPNQYLRGTAGDDVLIGGSGNDRLYGGTGDDILHGGAGNDRLEGGAGNDTYLFGIGDGHDVIHDFDHARADKDIVKLGDGIGADDIELLVDKPVNSTYLMHLIIRIKSTGETLTFLNAISSNTANDIFRIHAIQFADGTVWDRETILGQPMRMVDGLISAHAEYNGSTIVGNESNNTINGSAERDTFYGGGGDDRLFGQGGDDILHGGAGNDRLEGGAGNDTYLFGIGDGHDVIHEHETRTDRRNIVRLGEGITATDIEFVSKLTSAGLCDFIIRIKDTGETLTVSGGLSTTYGNIDNANSIQAIEFADGTVLNWNDIIRHGYHVHQGSTVAYLGSEGGTLTVDDDVGCIMYGGKGSDALIGGGGNDTLTAREGNDVLDGRGGNDRLYGGKGDDTYLFGRGYGHDTIFEEETRADRRNIVRLAPGLTLDDIEFLVKPVVGGVEDFIIRIIDTGETLTISGGLTTSNGTNIGNSSSIQAIQFDDGSTMEWKDILRHGLHVHESSTVGHLGGEGGLLIGHPGAASILGGGIGDDTLIGSSERDSLAGHDGNDTLIGGGGDDLLYGGKGDDTYVYGWGDGHDTIYEGGGDDAIIFNGISLRDLWCRRDGVQLVIEVGGSDAITINRFFDPDTNGFTKVEHFYAEDGSFSCDQLGQMIQSIASFGVEQGFSGQWTQDERQQAVDAVLSTYWQAAGK